MADRGFELVEIEDTGEIFEWKRCEVPGCPHLINFDLSGKWCWPHSLMGGDPSAADEKEPMKSDATS